YLALLVLPPRHATTLFPYTTLFRSLRRPIRGEHDLLVPLEQRVERVEELFLRHFLAFEEMHVVHQEEVHVVAVPAPELRHRARVDRKSTRLNSSHQIISYAVFCLKN